MRRYLPTKNVAVIALNLTPGDPATRRPALPAVLAVGRLQDACILKQIETLSETRT